MGSRSLNLNEFDVPTSLCMLKAEWDPLETHLFAVLVLKVLPKRYNAQLAIKEMGLKIGSHACTRPYLQKAYVYHWSGGHKPWVRLSQTEIKHNAIDPLQTSSRVDSVAAEAERTVTEERQELANWDETIPYCGVFSDPFSKYVRWLHMCFPPSCILWIRIISFRSVALISASTKLNTDSCLQIFGKTGKSHQTLACRLFSTLDIFSSIR